MRLDVKEVTAVQNRTVRFAVECVIKCFTLPAKLPLWPSRLSNRKTGWLGWPCASSSSTSTFQFLSFRRNGRDLSRKLLPEVDLNNIAISLHQKPFQRAFGADVEGLHNASLLHTTGCRKKERLNPKAGGLGFQLLRERGLDITGEMGTASVR